MSYTYKQMKNLFLRQSYLDSWEDYERSLNKSNFLRWDYVILTASNEAQAATYQEQIDYRLTNGQLPAAVRYAVLADPDGKRVGSGGATFNVLRYLAAEDPAEKNPFRNKRILVIHSGGDSKRVPQYSALGKLFSPVPRELPDGRASTLFDEFMIGMSGVPSRFREGMLVLSGDVLLLFNPLQIDATFHGAAAISMKEHVNTGKDHGVFLNDGNDNVRRFLHKQTEECLREVGAVNGQDCVDLDTGAVLLDSELLNALYGLISTDGKPDERKFREFVNEEARVSFYGDFLYPLAGEADLETYYTEAAEGEINASLLFCRKRIWEVLRSFSMKLICLSPAEFIHFGTTGELLSLVTGDVADYEFLDWRKQVVSTGCRTLGFAAHNAYIGHSASVGDGAYVENSYVLGESGVGEGAIVSNLSLRDCHVPAHTVWHGLQLQDGRYVVRVYGILDNPKARNPERISFLGTTLDAFMERNQVSYDEIWRDREDSLWFARLYPVCESREEACRAAEVLSEMAEGKAAEEEVRDWLQAERMSLFESFHKADVLEGNCFVRQLESRILANRFISLLEGEVYYQEALGVFGRRGLTEEIFTILMEDAREAEVSMKIRIYYALSRYLKHQRISIGGMSYDEAESLCFGEIQDMIYRDAVAHLTDGRNLLICKEQVDVQLPVRVNWGGGWTDTPPYCNEKGGVVLNAAIKLRGILPVQVTVRRLEELHVEFASQDVGVYGTAYTVKEIRDCHNPYDSFALHKAALIACGIVPLKGEESLDAILKRLGGGIYISTQVIGVPKGSGLGTSSILSAACVKAVFGFLGRELSNDEIYDIVLCMEQIMSTGGGWQDQVGGLTEGIKFIRSAPGVHQQLSVEPVKLSEETQKELQERFSLIYTGQRRLARNLLRDVVGNYIGARPESVRALGAMKRVSVLMRFELEQGNIDGFAKLLDEHWELSKQLDGGSTNTCIDQMFTVCEDLICGHFIAGAGGGGFLQVILKRGVTRQQLRDRLRAVFQDSGVDVWDCEILF